MNKFTLTEEKMDNFIDELLNDSSIKQEEIKILLYYKSNKKDSFSKRINDFKINVSKMQIDFGFDYLSPKMLFLYKEITRQLPSAGQSSIFNKLIKK